MHIVSLAGAATGQATEMVPPNQQAALAAAAAAGMMPNGQVAAAVPASPRQQVPVTTMTPTSPTGSVATPAGSVPQTPTGANPYMYNAFQSVSFPGDLRDENSVRSKCQNSSMFYFFDIKIDVQAKNPPKFRRCYPKILFKLKTHTFSQNSADETVILKRTVRST